MGVGEQSHHSPCTGPATKFSAQNSDVLVLFGLTVYAAHELALVTIAGNPGPIQCPLISPSAFAKSPNPLCI